MLLPGETVSLELRVLVDAPTARALNAGNDALHELLVLRVGGGRDYFVDVSASCARSCFATSLDELCATPGGALRRRYAAAAAGRGRRAPRSEVPKESGASSTRSGGAAR